MIRNRFSALLPSVAALLLCSSVAFAQEHPAVFPAGTKIMVRLNQPINSANAILGQSWDGTLVNAVTIGDRIVASPGASADGIISAIKRPGRLKGSGSISLILLHANDIAITSDVVTRDGEGHVRNNVTKIGGTAALGAGVGAAVGGGAGALVGAAAGAAAGTAEAAVTSKHPADMPAETVLTFTEQ